MGVYRLTKKVTDSDMAKKNRAGALTQASATLRAVKRVQPATAGAIIKAARIDADDAAAKERGVRFHLSRLHKAGLVSLSDR